MCHQMHSQIAVVYSHWLHLFDLVNLLFSFSQFLYLTPLYSDHNFQDFDVYLQKASVGKAKRCTNDSLGTTGFKLNMVFGLE